MGQYCRLGLDRDSHLASHENEAIVTKWQGDKKRINLGLGWTVVSEQPRRTILKYSICRTNQKEYWLPLFGNLALTSRADCGVCRFPT